MTLGIEPFFKSSYVRKTKRKPVLESNYLGSVRAVVSGQKIDFDNDNNANEPEVLSLTDYHEFGMTMQGRSFISSSGNYRFGYQGSERDPEALGGSAYTTEFRMLDPRLGRWFSPDPITHPWQSPYTSMDNNPIAMTDILGLDATSDGSTTGSLNPGGTATSLDPGGSFSSTSEGYGYGDSFTAPSGGTGAGSGSTGEDNPVPLFSFSTDAFAPTSSTSVASTTNAVLAYNTSSQYHSNPNTNTGTWNRIINATPDDITQSPWLSKNSQFMINFKTPKSMEDEPGVNIPSVINKVTWISQYDERVPGHGDYACRITCEYMLGINQRVKKKTELTTDGRAGSESPIVDAANVMKMVDNQLKTKAAIVGVNTGKGTQYGSASDHYIIIDYKGVDANGVYYHFLDPGTKRPEAGKSEKNRLYLKNGKFTGTTEYSGKTYTLTQLRGY